MYKEIREDFIKDLSDSVQRSYKLLFKKIDDYEKEKGLIFEEFTEEQFIEFTKEKLIGKSGASANVKVNLLKKYVNSLGKDFIKLKRNDLMKMTEDKLNQTSEQNESDIKYVEWKELDKNINKIENAIDVAIIYLLRYGVSGNQFIELRNLKVNDIDLDSKIVHLKDRDIEIDDKVADILKDAIEQDHYISMIHKEDTIKSNDYDFNMDCEYLIKQRPMDRNDGGLEPYTFSGFTAKVYRIFQALDMGISAINLLQSNAIEKLIQHEDSLGKRLSTREIKEYFKAVGITCYCYQMKEASRWIREKYKIGD